MPGSDAQASGPSCGDELRGSRSGDGGGEDMLGRPRGGLDGLGEGEPGGEGESEARWPRNGQVGAAEDGRRDGWILFSSWGYIASNFCGALLGTKKSFSMPCGLVPWPCGMTGHERRARGPPDRVRPSAGVCLWCGCAGDGTAPTCPVSRWPPRTQGKRVTVTVGSQVPATCSPPNPSPDATQTQGGAPPRHPALPHAAQGSLSLSHQPAGAAGY